MSCKVSVTYTFEAGHRILEHNGKCANPHGHSYKAAVVVACDKLDGLGMVADFADLKRSIGMWIDDNLDHTMILHPSDPLLDHPDFFPKKAPWVMPADMPEPTAENVARMIRREADLTIKRLYGERVWVVSVAVQETDGCHAISGGPVL